MTAFLWSWYSEMKTYYSQDSSHTQTEILNLILRNTFLQIFLPETTEWSVILALSIPSNYYFKFFFSMQAIFKAEI